MSQRFGSLRRVRGDNYCALRATLFQVLSHSTELPAWLQHEDIAMVRGRGRGFNLHMVIRETQTQREAAKTGKTTGLIILNAWCFQLPKELEVCEGLISHWTFPSECPQRDGTGDATQQLKGYLELLRNRVRPQSHDTTNLPTKPARSEALDPHV